jgi:5-methylcytosine-specific restriction protein A
MALRRTPLKPGKGLARRTPLRSGNRSAPLPTERPPSPGIDLAAAARVLARQQAATPPREFTGPVPEVSKPTPKPSNTGFPPVVRITILDRDHMRCQRCGRNVDAGTWGYSLQHRDNRAMGGTRDPRINLPSNGVTLCGSATSPDGCHLWAEQDRDGEASRLGFVVQSWADPLTVPMLTVDGWVLLDNKGCSWPTNPPPDGDAHAVARRKVPR